MKTFITLEGIDGSGKSTIIKELQKELNHMGYNTITTQEPFTRLYTPEIRSILNKDLSYEINETLIKYFHRDRLMHHDWIKEQSGIVICDRFKLSSIVYQSVISLLHSKMEYNLNNLKTTMERIKIINSDIPYEDICFYIDVDPEETKKRFKDDAEKIDTNYELQKKLYHAYKIVDYPYITIKDSSTQESVFRIIEKLKEIL